MKRKPADLFLREIMRWEPESGFLRAEQHMRRLCRSADALGFRSPSDPLKQLAAHVSGDAAMKVSLQLNHRGDLAIETELFQPLPSTAVWRIKLAEKTRLDSQDTFYRHKSTRREPYLAARLEHDAKKFDEVLLLNERSEVCEGTQTSLFIDDGSGTLLTPPLDSGILPGVLRADLIRARQARIQSILPKDLQEKEFFVGNSLHGLIAARLV
jgi:4-amino-4-deoxychorismate lyase